MEDVKKGFLEVGCNDLPYPGHAWRWHRSHARRNYLMFNLGEAHEN